MTEEQLIQLATSVGNDTIRELDSERIARVVLERLATEPVGRVGRSRAIAIRVSLGVAAAAAAILLFMQSPAPPTPAKEPVTVLHELDDLTVSELEVLLETLPPAAGDAAHPDPASVEELDAQSLERLLRSLEG